jgi:hypothetical protein
MIILTEQEKTQSLETSTIGSKPVTVAERISSTYGREVEESRLPERLRNLDIMPSDDDAGG